MGLHMRGPWLTRPLQEAGGGHLSQHPRASPAWQKLLGNAWILHEAPRLQTWLCWSWALPVLTLMGPCLFVCLTVRNCGTIQVQQGARA